MNTGLVSVSFRKLTVEEIVELCVQRHLDSIEWGGDIHVPLGDLTAAEKAGRLTREAGMQVSCYGSYVRMTEEERPLFADLIATTQALGASMIRVWAGKSEDTDMDVIVESAQMLCDMAPDILISFEFHGGTLTHDAQTARKLLSAIDRPNIRTQWQPPVNLPEDKCLEAIEAVRPWIANIHVFSWAGIDRLPLSDHEDRWTKYLAALQGERTALLEFVQNDDPAQLAEDAATLHRLLPDA